MSNWSKLIHIDERRWRRRRCGAQHDEMRNEKDFVVGFFFCKILLLLKSLKCRFTGFRESHPGATVLESVGVQFDSRGAFHKQEENR